MSAAAAFNRIKAMQALLAHGADVHNADKVAPPPLNQVARTCKIARHCLFGMCVWCLLSDRCMLSIEHAMFSAGLHLRVRVCPSLC